MTEQKQTEEQQKLAQEMQQKYMAYQVAEQQIKQHQDQLKKFEQQLSEITNVVSALNDVSKAEKETEVLVPLAGGIFFKAKVDNTQKFLVNVGMGTVVEKNASDTKELINSQIDEIEKYKEQVTANLATLVTEYQMLQTELQQISK